MTIGQFMPFVAGEVLLPTEVTLLDHRRITTVGPSYSVSMNFGTGEGVILGITGVAYTTQYGIRDNLRIGGRAPLVLGGAGVVGSSPIYKLAWFFHDPYAVGTQTVTWSASTNYFENGFGIGIWQVSNLKSVTPTASYASGSAFPQTFYMNVEAGGTILGIATPGRAVNGNTPSWSNLTANQIYVGAANGATYPIIIASRAFPDGGNIGMTVSSNAHYYPVCCAIALR